MMDTLFSGMKYKNIRHALPIIAIMAILNGACQFSHKGPANEDWPEYAAETLMEIINHSIKWPEDMHEFGPDSLSLKTVMNSHAKIVFHVSLDCSVCAAKFAYWDNAIKSFKRNHNIELPVLAIVSYQDQNSPANIQDLWTHAWIRDSERSFTLQNNMTDDRFQVAIIDMSDTIRLVGDPLYNKELGKLYEKTMLRYLR